MEINISKALEGEFAKIDEKVSLDDNLISVRDGKFQSPASIKGYYVVSGEDIAVKFNVSVKVLFKCDRCLEDVEYELQSDFSKSFKRNEAKEGNEGEVIDLTDYINESIILELPTKILCKEDCKGLCQNCGVNLNKESCKCKRENDDIKNNPFSVLKDIKF